MLPVGAKAPDFSGLDQRGRPISLSELVESGWVILYFYPKDFTRVCTEQACLLRDAYEGLQQRKVSVVGVSLDDDATHERFARELELPFPLLSDSERLIARSYRVLRFFGLMTKRVTYAIDPEQIIRGVFHYELSAARHLTEINKLLDQAAVSAGSA